MLKIYLCAFLSTIYLEEAKVCIESIRTHGDFKGTIYLFTDMDVFIKDVEVIKTKCASVNLSASYRTRLFDHLKDLSDNDVFLYLDTDIIVLKPLPTFDDIDNKIHVYGYPKRTQKEHSFAGFITNDINYTSQTAICSGILLFRPSLMVKKVFDDIYKLYIDLINKGKINACWEQPALCYVLIEQDMFNISLTDYVYEERTKNKISDNHIFNHFCGMRGDSRYNNMKKYLNV